MPDWTGWVLLLIVVVILADVIRRYLRTKARMANFLADEDEEQETVDAALTHRQAVVEWASGQVAVYPRYEVMIVDWAETDETYLDSEMRYRWSVWDGNRHLHDDTLFGLKPLPDNGLLMLGNAPTRPEAEIAAMVWVSTDSENGGTIRLILSAVTSLPARFVTDDESWQQAVAAQRNEARIRAQVSDPSAFTKITLDPS